MAIKKRNVFLVYVYMIITLGIYQIYWLVKTKDEMNDELGAEIPTAWLLIIPIVNIYWLYKYCQGFATKVEKDNNTVLWFLVFMVVGIIMPAIVQLKLNDLA